MSSYLACTVRVRPAEADALCGLAHAAGCLGLEERETRDGLTEYIIYFAPGTDAARVRAALAPAAASLAAAAADGRNWAEEFERGLAPFQLTESVWIFPGDTSRDLAPGEISLRVTPQMTFGTGLHATTRLCAALIEQEAGNRGNFLDAGTGTGILALLAAKLGAGPVTACDNDPACADNAAENFRSNGWEDIRLVIGTPDAFRGRGIFRTIACNMITSQFLPCLGHFHGLLEEGGMLLLSGILAEERNGVEAAVKKAGFSVRRILEEQEWVGMACIRSSAR